MMRRLDTLRRHSYKARPLGGVLLALWVTVAGAEVVSGAQLPDGSQKVGENRYRAPRDFDATLDYYKSVYPASSYPRKSIVNQPGVKAVHISNPTGKNFEGLNIYEANNEEVRIYVVPLQQAPKPVKKPESKPGRKTK
ncbi:hypothetical protein DRW03_00805 [Corallococcus sp. H22C18031201]|uniref:hypothetical protein n=1 Tax=Citreicoccus inhibens TaxID=2849499 RepID=UPI000E71B428|nr:hypothetical protein [Citreicoccus inhibens]MBU8898227.1 hypothetical protein [Citreicoccus inhibens]RJS26960.1 hypothetical protein DRW03_00805 [Corallococcus sp. H22C18031201]